LILIVWLTSAMMFTGMTENTCLLRIRNGDRVFRHL
jgi:hypothetical protein